MTRFLIALVLSAALGVANAQARLDAETKDTLDREITAILDASSVPGAVVVMTRGDSIAYQLAYGDDVSVDTSAFRIASLTKSFTALLAIDLADDGIVDLDTSIETYLGADTPALPFGPVTLRQLLSHTSGLDQTDIADSARSAAEQLSIYAFVNDRLAAQRNAPDELYRYSNHGYVLAGLVLERAAGLPFATLMRDRVLVPLGIDAAALDARALPGEVRLLAGHTADGSSVDENFSNMTPADGLMATGAALAPYLQYQSGGLSVDSLPSTEQLHAVAFAHTSSVPQAGLGWELRRWTGKKVLTHTGGLPGFTSYFAVVPDDNVGLFIALNARASGVRGDILGVFFDALYPSLEPADRDVLPIPVAEPSKLNNYVGTYRSLNHPMGFEQFAVRLGLIGETVNVAISDGELSIDGSAYTEIRPGEFARPYGDGGLTVWRFDAGADGPRVHSGHTTYRKLSALDSPGLLVVLLVSGLVVGVIRGVLMPLYTRLRKQEPGGVALLTYASLAQLAAGALTVAGLSAGLDFGVPILLHVAVWLNLLPGVLAALALLVAIRQRTGASVAMREVVLAVTLIVAGVTAYGVGISGPVLL